MASAIRGAIGGFAKGAGAGMADLQRHFQTKSLWNQRNKLLLEMEQVRNKYATDRAQIRMDFDQGMQRDRFTHDDAATTGVPVPGGRVGLQDRTGKITGYRSDPETGDAYKYPSPLSEQQKLEFKYLMQRDKGLLGVISSDMATPEHKTAAQAERQTVQAQIRAILHPSTDNAGSGTGEQTVTDPDAPGSGEGAAMPEREGALMPGSDVASEGIIGELSSAATELPGLDTERSMLTRPLLEVGRWAGAAIDAAKPYMPFSGHYPDQAPQTPQDVMTQGREIVNSIMRRPLRPPQAPGGIMGEQPPSGTGPSQYGTDALPSADTPHQQSRDELTTPHIEGMQSPVVPPADPQGAPTAPAPTATSPMTAAPYHNPNLANPTFEEETWDPATRSFNQGDSPPLPRGEVSYGQLEQVPNASAPAPQGGGIVGQPTADPYARPRDLTTERAALSPAAPMQRAEPQSLGIVGTTPTGPEGPPLFGDPKHYGSDIYAAMGRAFGTSEQPPAEPETPAGEDAWTDIAIQSIMEHEKFRDSPYPDRGGTQATGYGMNLNTGERTFADGAPRPTNPTEPEGQRAMVEDVALAASRVVKSIGRDVWGRLSPVRKAVLVEMAYQHGGAGLRGFDETLAAVAGEDWQMAADEMMDSDTGQETSPDRMATLAQRMLTGRL